MLIFTFSFVVCCIMFEEIREFQIEYWPIVVVCLIIYLVIAITLICFTQVSRTSPINWILLLILTLALTYTVGFITAFYSPELVGLALLLTLAGFVGMTLWAMMMPYDLT